MNRRERPSLLLGVLCLSIPLLWAVAAVTIDGGSDMLSPVDAACYSVAGVFVIALRVSSRVRTACRSLAETTVVQFGGLVFGLGLLAVAGIAIYGVAVAIDAGSTGDYLGAAFWIVVLGTGGIGVTCASARALLHR
ncbi:hypothetical protein [Halopiger xanaduensis]|uniref:Uncharacterized protein n=1 Tax=Halopiger xanaduensis (strain DSM 18323 / JCM 14033 / SH-6) TaxID=797210 RepID=F8DBQ6_HALXS|nr:hypothetical protein [Halopiger xanaduensis]AEH38327.1 hypothetical protein Halxa_3720 [Halopiger xanaduensis SH-6]